MFCSILFVWLGLVWCGWCIFKSLESNKMCLIWLNISSVYISSAKFYAVIWLVLNLVTITKGRITFSINFIIDCMTMEFIYANYVWRGNNFMMKKKCKLCAAFEIWWNFNLFYERKSHEKCVAIRSTIIICEQTSWCTANRLHHDGFHRKLFQPHEKWRNEFFTQST